MNLSLSHRNLLADCPRFLLIFIAFCAPLWAAATGTATQPPAFAIANVNVFDGERLIPRTTVVVEDHKVAAVGRRARVSAGMEVIDGSGMTLLPGLIDAHSHDECGRHLLRSALMFGVTTDLDMFATDPTFATEVRRGTLAVVHVSDEAHARLALEVGADGLGHVYWNGEPATDIARLAAKRGAFVIPTAQERGREYPRRQ